ncbi:MAG: helix-turn-helix transcriptional regulator [Tepidisphaeraceae bacterium]|jgi:transcriptional regulator with XRE-family HTH domain
MSSEKFQQVTGYSAVVGAILAALRRDARFDQETMAKKAGLTQSAWSRIEAGATQITVSQLATAARALQMTPSGIMKRADALASQLSRGGVRVEDSVPRDPKSSHIVVGRATLIALASKLLTRGE